ncbi:hypothetical protein BN7_4367 [Wickerhamomyces ciferrii]|uniref:Uncharacterized protein n=1 Tax=Wickerhamomyces ciferrii (strain ATCC 14091 / BCRC 22168 / CBS 111 / JCM 3599 / NBRC 0793 / NRRL Y-1031 F-60-10) TaxID=1206466 RepID=K0KTU5_WICCF|nr:uncharacterized protein BN7_4367 [Wickerhamomyces ciferrii]CCH44799.1 hypothetical protein BN7_4367 [Wickerhamomyces ciferrii]
MAVENSKRLYSQTDVAERDGDEFEIDDGAQENDIDIDGFLSQKIDFSKSKRARRIAKFSQATQVLDDADPVS